MSRAAFIARYFYISLLCLGAVALLPVIDVLSFHFLNGHLQWMPSFYNASFAVMNHRLESQMNVVVIFGSMMVGIPVKKSLNAHLKLLLILALWYELFFQSINYAEKHLLISRASPSVLFGLHVNLANFDSTNMVKVYAHSSFPSGHAMVLGYWYQVARYLFSEPWRKISMVLSVLMCLPRLVAGAHWLSDVIIGFALGSGAYFVLDNLIKKEKS